MKINTIKSDLLSSNMYIVVEENHAIVIDPCNNTDFYDKKIYFDWIFLTHEHIDHISGVNEWKKMTNAKVICNDECAKNIEDPRCNMSHFFNAFCDIQNVDINHIVHDYICNADLTYKEYKKLDWQNHEIVFFHIPGHSPGSSLIIIDGLIVFSGDSIFKNFPTECRFPGGSLKRWKESALPQIKRINPNAVVYPGHYDYFKMKEITYEL